MKGQRYFLLGLLFALIIAILAIINNEPVQFNYLFGSQEWPLILVILGSAIFGGIVAASLSFVKIVQLNSQIRQLNKKLNDMPQPEHAVPVEEKPMEQPYKE
ncbi:LapA family protein [Metabacillus iocasae]|uniref:Integral membrane protein n=1 Tax=Priestia iocasae TaxID=2291674 RepID=A0ABS2QT91_9BACI|nr:LapA family protein [Metabacillus iocasae]MBM7702247.1 putative integral membrane protein [Metabacillus iocasae]